MPKKKEAILDVVGQGPGVKARLEDSREINLRDIYRLDGFLFQLAENGRVMKIDRTDQAYRELVWRYLGLSGAAKSWEIIFSLIRFLPRRYVSHVLYVAAADWLVLKNESVKLAFESLAANNFTILEALTVMKTVEGQMLTRLLADTAQKIPAWKDFLEVDRDTAATAETELVRARQRQRGQAEGLGGLANES